MKRKPDYLDKNIEFFKGLEKGNLEGLKRILNSKEKLEKLKKLRHERDCEEGNVDCYEADD